MTVNGLSDANRKRVLEKALLSRFVEEQLLTLFSEGKLHGTVHTCIGQEFSGAVITEFLLPSDTLFSNHRCHGHFLSRNGDIEGLIAELMGRQTGVSGGLGGSQHLYKDGFYSNGIQGGIVPVAAGLALGHKLKKNGAISVVFIGDGTLGEGVVYETLNIASKWELPLLVVLEDNKYSQSTEQSETLAGDIDARFDSFGIETVRANTWNWEDLHAKAELLITGMRSDSKPRFLHIDTYRLKAHSKGDDTRSREVVEPFEKIDPLNILLAEQGEATWITSIRGQIKDAVARAELSANACLPPEVIKPVHISWANAKLTDRNRVVSALNETLKKLMKEHPETIFMGEDVLSPYGGAFKVSKGLSDNFPGRVRNTPISEGAIVGIGIGLGLTGFHPLVEIMFGDFLGLAFDQLLNHASKFQQMYNQQVVTNVTVRTPMGGGRGYGPTHSQTLDRHFLGMPGLRVLAMNHLTHPEQIYRPLMSSNAGPTLLIENKLLYSSYLLDAPPKGYQLLHSDETFPTAWLKPEAEVVDVTLLGYGGTSELLLEASEVLFEEHDLIAQVVSVMKIYPFNVDALIEPLALAKQLLIVEEGQAFAGFGAEVVTQIAERDLLQGLKLRRLAPGGHCIPASGPLEKTVLPSVAGIVEAVLKMRQP
jgi:2-oxoisovalerate dehydrogenase E1 component